MVPRQYHWGPKTDIPVDFDIGWVDEVTISSAGFNPNDEELVIGELTEEWDHNPTGSLVISGLSVEGHPFTVLPGFGICDGCDELVESHFEVNLKMRLCERCWPESGDDTFTYAWEVA